MASGVNAGNMASTPQELPADAANYNNLKLVNYTNLTETLQQLRGVIAELEAEKSKLLHTHESEAALIEANLMRVSAQLSAAVNRSHELHGELHYGLTLKNWTYYMNGISTCGLFYLRVQADVVTHAWAQQCSPWCRVRFPLWNSMLSFYRPAPPFMGFHGLQGFPYHARVWDPSTFYLWPLVVAFMAVWVIFMASAFLCWHLWFWVMRWLLLSLILPIQCVCLVFVYIPLMALCGEPVTLCSKVESAALAGALPKTAGPVAGLTVMAIGSLLIQLKRWFCTQYRFETKESLKDMLHGLSEGGETQDGAFMVIGIEFPQRETVKAETVGILNRGDITKLMKSRSAQRKVLELHLTVEAGTIHTLVGGYEQILLEVGEKVKDMVEDVEEEIKDGAARTEKIFGIQVGDSQVTSAECTFALTTTFFSSSKQELLAWLKRHEEEDTIIWDLQLCVILRPESKGLAFKKRDGGTCAMLKKVMNYFFLLLPASDNYSDVAQTVSFMRRGQPFYCCYNSVGILSNVIIGLKRTPPLTQGRWYVVDVVGRFFQADVIEAAAQSLRVGQKTQMFWEKTAIQASTESVQNLMITLMALFQSERLRAQGVGLHLPASWGVADVALQYLLDFVLVSGDLGMVSNLLLSLHSIYSGLGTAPQYVWEIERQRIAAVPVEEGEEAVFEPQPAIAVLRLMELSSLSCTIVVAAARTRKFLAVYVGVALLTFVSHRPLNQEGEGQRGLVLEVLQAIFWPLYPSALSWPWDKKFAAKFPVIWFYSVRSVCFILLWVCFFANEAMLGGDCWSENTLSAGCICKEVVVTIGLCASMGLPLVVCYVLGKDENQNDESQPPLLTGSNAFLHEHD